jgi:putative phosphoribosyl transferase
MVIFKNRTDAGIKLAALLRKYSKWPEVVVIGLARGGVVTAAVVAHALMVPLDVMVVRKIGAPMEEELALGAITVHGVTVLHQALIKQFAVSEDYLAATIAREQAECAKREELYRSHHAAISLKNKTVIIVDDGIATGATIEAAIKDVRQQHARKIIVAVPVLPSDMVATMRTLCDELVFLKAPDSFLAIGAFYQDFEQVNHDEVIAVLKQ